MGVNNDCDCHDFRYPVCFDGSSLARVIEGIGDAYEKHSEQLRRAVEYGWTVSDDTELSLVPGDTSLVTTAEWRTTIETCPESCSRRGAA